MPKLPFEKKREIFVKKEADTNPKFGCKPEKRSVEQLFDYGIINLNKPKGPTSHMCSDHVKKILKIEKAGHGGSLDPGVTGVLPTALGKATRITQTLLPAGKEYVCIMHLHKDVPQQQFEKVIKQFKGKIKQFPPVKSAVKRQLREREIYYFDILEVDGKDILFKMGCQAGTYVRKVCHDIGRALKVGAHMAELVRTKAGPFTDKDWVTLQDLEDAFAYYQEGNDKFIRHCIKPVEFAIQYLPKIWIQDNAVNTVCHGASLNIPGVSKLSSFEKDEFVAILSLKNELVALGMAVLPSKEILDKDRGLCIKISKVFMQSGTYSVGKKD